MRSRDIQCRDIANLPFVTLRGLKNLPYKSGLYFVTFKGCRILYIGKSINMRARWIQHDVKDRLIKSKVHVRIHYLEINDTSRLETAELILIKKFKPILNARGLDRDFHHSMQRLYFPNLDRW